MENSKIELIFPYFLIFIFIFASISQKMAYKMSQKRFSRNFMKISIYCNYSKKRTKRLKFHFLRGRSFKRDVYLQIRSIVDIAFLFNTRQAIEKTTILHYNLFICFILDHIHFLLASSSSEGENECIYGITFIN